MSILYGRKVYRGLWSSEVYEFGQNVVTIRIPRRIKCLLIIRTVFSRI